MESKSDTTMTRVLPASDAILQISSSMHMIQPQPLVTVPIYTTVQAALSCVASALGTVDGSVVFFPRRTERQRQILRETALQNVKDWESSQSSNAPRASPALPIRSSVDMKTLGYPKPSSQITRDKLKENAKDLDFRQPYAMTIRASLMDKTLPTIKGNIRLRPLDTPESDGGFRLPEHDMLWDTGAQQTFITEELLSTEVQKSLRNPSHDIYRVGNGLRLQMEAYIGLSNAAVSITAIVMVVPKSEMPNEFVGIILGQSFCIDRLAYRSVPRCILKARGEDVADDVWGDIVAEEYIDEEENHVKFE
jgi:hypothetical protein